MALTIPEARDDDAEGIVRLGRENSRYYVRLAPELFRLPDEEGFVEFIRNDREWREGPDNLALVADDGGAIAGYLEAFWEWRMGYDRRAIIFRKRLE